MLKDHKWKLIVTTLVFLIPIAIGVLLWNKLPNEVPIHWNAEGVVDGWSSKTFAVLGLPFILMAVHWVCILITMADPKRKNQSEAMKMVTFWICPMICLVISVMIYGSSLGMEFRMDRIMSMIFGVMFIVLGIFMPKCKQNFTMGIKVPWTLNDEENWDYTHRIAGKVWIAMGIVILLSSLLPAKWLFVIVMICTSIAVAIPTICSYLFYKKKENKAE